MIEIKAITASYHQEKQHIPVLDNLALTVEKGTICAIIGPSGCGKSTLLHIIAGIKGDYQGQVLMDGAPIDPQKQRIGFIQQHYGLFDWATVYKNATLGLRVKGGKRTSETPAVRRVFDSLGLWPLRNKYPRQLSGGERQRVSIAQSFLLQPDILLMDEPFSALDAINREKMQEIFIEVWQQYQVSALFVTHSIEEALFVGQTIAIMSPAPGRILEVGENPLFGTADLRMQKTYYEMVAALREKVGVLWA